MILCADYIVTMDGNPIRDGAIVIKDHHIQFVGALSELPSYPDETIKIIPETVLLPGLINAHCHLEQGYARGVLPNKEGKAMWDARLRKLKSEQSSQAFADAVQLGVLECIRTGTTTILDVGETGMSPSVLKRSDIRSFVYKELAALQPKDVLSLIDTEIPNFLKQFNKKRELTMAGLAPESPYTCHSDLITAAEIYAKNMAVPLPFHFSESTEELELYKKGKGRLFEYYKRKHGLAPLYSLSSQLDILQKSNLLNSSALLIHANQLSPDVIHALCRCGASIVHCPRNHAFTEQPPFPFEMYFNHGLNVCLGTESLASCENLNLFDEALAFRSQFPQVECSEILKMITIRPARALGRENDLGKLKPGFLADIVGIRLKHSQKSDLFDELICESHEVNFVMINGREVMS